MNQEKEPSNTMLYVSNLPFSFEDNDLKAIFDSFEVESAYVAVRRNGRSKGFGFVTFKSSDEQQKALDKFDGHELDGRALTVKIAHKDERRDAKGELKEEFKTADRQQPRRRNKKEGDDEKTPSETVLYVSNLPFEFDEDALLKVFAAHTPVGARIARRRTERSKGFGFVEFGSHDDQQAALALDGHDIEGREISVKVSMVGALSDEPAGGEKKQKKPRERKAKAAAPAEEVAPPVNTVYVSNLPFDLSDDMLADLFKSKGHNPVSARIARRRDDRSKGFGFVEFADEAQQQAAIAAVDETSLGERTISCKVALKGSAEPRSNDNNGGAAPKRKRNRKRGGGGADGDKPAPVRKEKKDSETLVYVSNLSFDVDDNALAKLFDGLTIKSAHVAVRHNGKSKGFGFVDFASSDDQKKALEKNGSELFGRALTVEIAKEEVEDAQE